MNAIENQMLTEVCWDFLHGFHGGLLKVYDGEFNGIYSRRGDGLVDANGIE